MNKNTRKRSLIAGGIAAVLVAGVTAGGALVTRDSTILDNVFGAVTTPESPADFTVKGDPMKYDFSGAVDGELVYEYYAVKNLSEANDLKFNVSAKPHASNDEIKKLMANLDTRIVIDGTTIETGKLDKMAIPAASQPLIEAGTETSIRVEVYVADSAAFKAANIAPDTRVTVDYLFDSIFLG
ncbi:hypothetical protein J7E45_09405 [Microbacterium sp. ISL-59]|uniref:hypothetical protein n=1 Tax=Microbacterium sp. ISL-59 TaxID=2819159 RepID=UPI001BECD00E|nr:hypothetical protein [Microbacterium sp. ISL-59]MBT2495824.1 hypothetical protein [Microbacterium sp. ISL-59]